ncbi:putative alpha/beta-hydrolase lipase region family protein [Saccharomyces cerevisiae]|nr:putative alpha/beta-hydrolase lipase region family protein [Saccharomyces cerevisiae]
MTSNASLSENGDGNANIKMETNVNQAPYAAENPFQNIALAEDTKLVPDLKYYYKEYGIDIEEFEVETDDGFIIDLWHFKSRLNDGVEEVKREPILLLHGLLQSCGAFASSGRKSLAYFLYESGFDVWLGNNRCGLNAKWNMKKLGNDHSKKWDWDMHQMVQYDLKALINYVLDSTGYAKLSLVAHSQGTTQGFMGLVNGEKLYASDFKLVDKLENFVALAPAVYPGPLLDEKAFVRLMAKGIDSPWYFGRRSFIPLMMTMRKLMVGTKIFSKIFPDKKTWFPIAKNDDDSGNNLDNNKLHLNPKRQNSEEFPHIIMFIPKQDRLVDGERLINHFINHEANAVYKIWYIDEYSHLDVLWAHDVIDRIGKPMIENLRFPNAR